MISLIYFLITFFLSLIISTYKNSFLSFISNNIDGRALILTKNDDKFTIIIGKFPLEKLDKYWLK